jgi:hypothetical protein
MARPQKEGLDYFPHDTDSASDEKIEALMMLYGAKGYVFYFILLERIYRTPNFELDISDAETIQILSRKMSVTTAEFNQMLKSAFKHRCFDEEKYKEEGVLTSNGIKKRAGIVTEKREKMRVAYENKKQKISDAETGEETAPETPQRKGKERKEKNYSLEIENFRQRYQGFIGLVDKYIDILKMTRVSGKIANSVLLGVYEQMDKHPVIVVKYAINTIIHNPSLHSKKENYFFGILRNTKADEAAEKLSKINNPKTMEEEIRW